MVTPENIADLRKFVEWFQTVPVELITKGYAVRADDEHDSWVNNPPLGELMNEKNPHCSLGWMGYFAVKTHKNTSILKDYDEVVLGPFLRQAYGLTDLEISALWHTNDTAPVEERRSEVLYVLQRIINGEHVEWAWPVVFIKQSEMV